MKWYLLRRLLWTGVATLVILTVTFVLMDLVPNQRVLEAQFQAAQQGVDVETAVQAERERLGLDRPTHVRYFDFLQSVLQLEWGWSYEYNRPVREVVLRKAPYSLMYGLPAILVSTVLGIAIGLYSAVNQYTKRDYVATFGAFFGISIPNFWFGIVLLVVFGSVLGWVEIGFNPQLAENAAGNLVWLDTATASHPAFIGEDVDGPRRVGILSPGNLKQLILPTVVVMTASIASVMRFARAEALEYVDADFVKTAKAKGVGNWRIVGKHVLRPAAVPLTTIIVGRILGLVLFGAYVTELVFGIPGIGLASFRAVLTQDTNLVMITVLLPTFLIVLGNLLEDLIYVVLDPRIDYGDR
jgi:peptide/nickel transport system permease protein